jgi:hypothetical protein
VLPDDGGRVMNIRFITALVIGVAFSLPAMADPPGPPNSNPSTPLNGTIVSKSVPFVGNTPATVLTTPNSGNFVLTQACTKGSIYTTISGSTFGFIAILPFNGNSIINCVAFAPGVALPKGENLNCTSDQDGNCMVTGVWQK